jgi:aspartate aminotransferase
VSAISPSPSLAVSAEIRRLRAEGRDVLDLGVGEPDFPAIGIAKAAARAAIDADDSHYTPTPGTPEVREAIAASHRRLHGTDARAEEVVVGCGAKAVLYELLQCLVDPGDDVVVSTPYWVSFPAQVSLAGGRLVEAPADPEDGFVPRAAQVEAALGPRTRAVIVNSPCNPTGAVMPADEVEELVRLCGERGVPLIFDEVYDRFVYEGEHCSPLRFRDLHPDGIACVGAASKSFAMTGWRLGHGILTGGLAAAVSRLQGHLTSGANSLAQAAAAAAYRDGDAEASDMLAEFRARRDLTVEALRGIEGVACRRPEGAFFAFPSIDLGTSAPVDSVSFARHVLMESGVGLVPGTAFGLGGHVRLSYAVSRADLDEALSRLAATVAALRRDPGRLEADPR